MARPFKPRIVEFEPNVTYFKPRAIPLSELEEVTLTVGEFEALRLSDSLQLNQTDAAKKMGFHQSTFQRTLAKAREKIADAIVNGKAIKINGGAYKMPRGDGTGPLGMGRGMGAGRGRGFGGPQTCKCPKCGNEQPHQRGMPCAQTKCPKCGTVMIRGDI